MKEERLQEIKDSVEFQYKLAKAKGVDNALLFTNEEEELIEEIERLNNIITELEKWLWDERYNHKGEYVFTGKGKIEDIYTMILDKIKELKGSDKE